MRNSSAFRVAAACRSHAAYSSSPFMAATTESPSSPLSEPPEDEAGAEGGGEGGSEGRGEGVSALVRLSHPSSQLRRVGFAFAAASSVRKAAVTASAAACQSASDGPREAATASFAACGSASDGPESSVTDCATFSALRTVSVPKRPLTRSAFSTP